MPVRTYPLHRTLLAWHEAGHAAVIEALGDAWIDAAADFENLSGYVRTAPSQSGEAKPFDSSRAPRAVIGISPQLKAISRKVAIQFYAGIAAERLYLGLPFDAQAFSDDDFSDFAAARWMLSLTNACGDAAYCARVACDFVVLQRDRIERLARRLLGHGLVSFAEDLP